MSAPILTIGGRRFSFGKMSATNAVRVHVALLRVFGEALLKLLVLGKDKAPAPKHLPRAHGEPGTEPPPLPGVTPAPADGATAADAEAPAEDVNVMGVSLSEEDIATMSGAVGLMMAKMDPDEMISTLRLVLGYVNCEGRPIADIDITFGDGRSLEMYRVFWEALKVNFAGFFPASLFASVVKARQK